MQIEHLAIMRSLLRRVVMFREVFEDGKSGHGENLFVAHETHSLVAELVGVVDGDYARARRIERAGFASGVNRDSLAAAGGFFNGGFQFSFRVLVNGGEAPVTNDVRAGL